MAAFLIGYFLLMILLIVNGVLRENGLLVGCGIVMVPFGLIFLLAIPLALLWPCETC